MASIKRKRHMPKFYAVRAGHQRGVFPTWEDCKAQTAGYSGAVYKAFNTLVDAEAFVAGKNPKKEDEPVRFYAVAVGTRPGIYTDWSSAQAAIQGAKGPKYKKFETREECVQFIKEKGNLAAYKAIGLMDGSADEDEDEDDDDDEEAQPAPKRTKTPGSRVSGSGNVVEIWTDGAAPGNGGKKAVAGVGVFFGHGDPRNISERLPGEVQTNQRAELTAIMRALQTVDSTENVVIYSDSSYSIKCVTDWCHGWRKKNWMTSNGPVKNRDLIEAVLDLIAVREQQGGSTKFKWVKGHSTNAGNVAADRLAVQGCRR